MVYWRQNLGKSGQDPMLGKMLNAIRLCKPGFTKSHRYLDNIVSLENRLHTTLGEIA